MLQAGVMEAGKYAPTYSGTPQGGIVSPILANIVLHELDAWLESQGINPPPETVVEQNARSNPLYTQPYYRNQTIRRYLDGVRKMPVGATPESLRQELRKNLKQLKQQPRKLPRKVTFYVRYADDFLVILCNTSKRKPFISKPPLQNG
jgi:RNA-directed DNA polymerase